MSRKPKRPDQPPSTAEALVLTITEATTRARLSRASLYRAMDEKRLRFLKYGTRRLIAKDDLDAFIESLRV
jgi:excisionase family DNA binding protein